MDGFNASWLVAVGIGILLVGIDYLLSERIKKQYGRTLLAIGCLAVLVGAVGLSRDLYIKLTTIPNRIASLPSEKAPATQSQTPISSASQTTLSPKSTQKHTPAHEHARANGAVPTTINNAPNGIAISGGTVENPTVNNFGPPPVQAKWKAEPIPSTRPQFSYETKVTVSVNAPYTPVSLGFLCDTGVEAVDFNLATGGAFLSTSQGTDTDNKKLAYIRFQGSAVTPDAPLYVFLWSSTPLRVLEVKPAIIRAPN